MSPGGFESGVDGGTCDLFIAQLLFKGNIFGMRFWNFSAVGCAYNLSVSNQDCAHFRMRPIIFGNTLACLLNGHKRESLVVIHTSRLCKLHMCITCELI